MTTQSREETLTYLKRAHPGESDKTTSTNTKMGVSYVSCLYTFIKIHASRERKLRGMHYAPFLGFS